MSVPRKIAMEFSWVSEIIAFVCFFVVKVKKKGCVVVGVVWGGFFGEKEELWYRYW